MERYFFHIFDGKEIFDDIGTLLRDENEVRFHMIALATTWIELGMHRDTHWSLEARDENETLVGEMRFGLRPDDA